MKHLLKRYWQVKVSLLIGICVPFGCNKSDLDRKSPMENIASKRTTSASNLETSDLVSQIRFENVASKLGLQQVYRNGEESDQYTYLEAMGGGLAVLDYDRDGWPDLFFPGGGNISAQHAVTPLPGTLWKNQFSEKLHNVTANSGLDNAAYYSQGVACGDFDNDGFPDLLVTGFGGVQMYANQGDGTFLEVSSPCGLHDPHWSSSAAFADFENDGNLDIYVAHYVDWTWENDPYCKSASGMREICPPGAYKGLTDTLFMNNGAGKFVAKSSELGLVAEGKGLGVLCADLDNDSKVDIYVANDATNNFLYHNTGSGHFEEIGVQSGTALDDRGNSNGSMGIAWIDFDSDLRPDLWVCNYENETFALYKNDGDNQFRYVSSSAGVASLGTLFVAFGVVASDLDADGDEDLAIVNGHVLRSPPGNSVAQQPLLLKNNGRGKLLREVSGETNYFGRKWRGRGIVALDFDRDGDTDLATSNVHQPAALLENKTNSNGNWIRMQLIGNQSNRDAVGSRILFQTNKRKVLRSISGGGSYMSQSSLDVHCAFPNDEILQQIEIQWPNGKSQRLTDVALNAFLQVIEPN